jgi:hypothetical protein
MACSVVIDRDDDLWGSELEHAVREHVQAPLASLPLDAVRLRLRRRAQGHWSCRLAARPARAAQVVLDALAGDPFSAADAAVACLQGRLGPAERAAPPAAAPPAWRDDATWKLVALGVWEAALVIAVLVVLLA